MTNVIPSGDAGMASAQYDQFTTVELFSGDTPVSTTPEVVAAAAITSADLPAFSVVGRNVSGELVLAQFGSINAIGITCSPVLQGATPRNVAAFRAGMFNPAALNWHSSYDTDAKKRLAFEAAQPTIFIRDNKYDNV